MESANHKRRGFLKSKLFNPLPRPANPLPPAHGGGSKVKPSPPTARDSPDAYYSTARRTALGIRSIPPVQTGSITKVNHVPGSSVGYKQQSPYHGDDENVDLEAARYIYNVRERFRSLVGVGSDQA